MTSNMRRALLAGLLVAPFAGALYAQAPAPGKTIRLHYPIVSSADNIETLRPVAATPNVPVYEDTAGRRFLVGVDFAPFLHAWLESHLARTGLSAQSPAVAVTDSAGAPGLLLELRDLRVELTSAEISYAGRITLMPPSGAPRRHEFKTLRVMFGTEEGRLEPHELLSHSFDSLLAAVRHQLVEDLAGQMHVVDAMLSGGRGTTKATQ